MEVTRIDLDGAGSPGALVTKILKAETTLSAPVPIEALARQLDIKDIREVVTENFEGGLITDVSRSDGFILVNKRSKGGRRRFTIGHELGHFLMTHHKPSRDQGFQCSRADMRRWDFNAPNGAFRMEAEANQFSALILMPPPLWRKATARYRDPDLTQVLALANDFQVSKEAAARNYAQYHDALVAVVVVKDDKILRLYRNVTRFPRLCVAPGSAVPSSSLLFHATRQTEHPTSLEEGRAEHWLVSDWGVTLPPLYEQVLFAKEEFALIMLWVEKPEEEDEQDDDRTSKERLRDRLATWRGER